jgi:hypothetical protein
MKQILFTTMCVVLFSLILSNSATAQNLPKKTHSHEIPLDSAKKYIQNLKKDAMQMKTKGGMFYREIFDKMLSQKGVIGIRYYYAKTDDGNPTIVLVGIDSSGKDMSTTAIAEGSYPCPPFCDTQTQLDK